MNTNSSSLYETLAAWLAPLEVDTFRKEFWAKRALFRAPSSRRLEPVSTLCPWDVDKLMARHTGEVAAWFQAPDGRHLSAPVEPRAARKLYQGGTTLYVRDVAELRPLEAAVAASLAVPKKNVMSGIFFSHAGAKTRAHFDPVDTITLQIKGQKRWRIAPNAHAPLPTVSWATLDRARTPELRYYADDTLPDVMPPGAEEFALQPGAVLYVPQGHWHETESDEESVSLHIHLKPLIWADALLDALRSKLLAEPGFRQPANNLWAPQARSEAAATAEALLRELSGAVSGLSADDVLPTAAPPFEVREGDRFVRRALTGLSATNEATPRVTVAVSEHGRERETTVQMSTPYLEACRLFAQGTNAPSWSAAELAAKTPGLSVDEALGLVRLLLDAGFLRRASPDRALGSGANVGAGGRVDRRVEVDARRVDGVGRRAARRRSRGRGGREGGHGACFKGRARSPLERKVRLRDMPGLIIDTDAGIDDLLAIAYLIMQPGVTVEAITVVNGLSHVPDGAKNVIRLLETVNKQNIPVYMGATSPLAGGTDFPADWRKTADELPGVTLPVASAKPQKGAIDFLAERFTSSQPFTLLALGPHTNLATALGETKGAFGAVTAMPMMGGAVFVPGNVDRDGNTTAEWNMFGDPAAASATFTSGLPIAMVPLDATNQVPIGRAFLHEAGKLKGPLGEAVHQLLKLGFTSNDGVYFAWDPLAAVSVVVPSVLASSLQGITLVTAPPEAGRTQSDPGGPNQVGVATGANAALFQSAFLGAF